MSVSVRVRVQCVVLCTDYNNIFEKIAQKKKPEQDDGCGNLFELTVSAKKNKKFVFLQYLEKC